MIWWIWFQSVCRLSPFTHRFAMHKTDTQYLTNPIWYRLRGNIEQIMGWLFSLFFFFLFFVVFVLFCFCCWRWFLFLFLFILRASKALSGSKSHELVPLAHAFLKDLSWNNCYAQVATHIAMLRMLLMPQDSTEDKLPNRVAAYTASKTSEIQFSPRWQQALSRQWLCCSGAR